MKYYKIVTVDYLFFGNKRYIPYAFGYYPVYFENVWVYPRKNKLFVFDNLEKALNMCDGDRNVCIFECEVKNPRQVNESDSNWLVSFDKNTILVDAVKLGKMVYKSCEEETIGY